MSILRRVSMSLYDFPCEVLAETELAFKLDVGEKEPVWFPKSQCEVDVNERGVGTLTCPEWLAIEKGLL